MSPEFEPTRAWIALPMRGVGTLDVRQLLLMLRAPAATDAPSGSRTCIDAVHAATIATASTA